MDEDLLGNHLAEKGMHVCCLINLIQRSWTVHIELYSLHIATLGILIAYKIAHLPLKKLFTKQIQTSAIGSHQKNKIIWYCFSRIKITI